MNWAPLCRTGLAIVAATVAGSSSSIAQVPQKLLSPAELQDDLGILRYTFERTHPVLYRYVTKEKIDSAFDCVAQQLGEPRTDLEFLRILTPLIEGIHDLHTTIHPGRDVLRYLNSSAKVFPFDIRYVDGRPFVEKNFSAVDRVPLGGEVVSINGREMSLITEQILRAKSADGFNQAPKYEIADFIFPLLYFQFVDAAESFDVEIRDPGTKAIVRVSTPGVPTRVVLTGQFITRRDTFALEFLSPSDVALMSIPSFGDTSLTEEFAHSFQAIQTKRIKTLIIDLRDNAGGIDEFNPELLSYLVDHPFRFYKGASFRAREWNDLKHVRYTPDDFFNTPDLVHHTSAELADLLHGRTLEQALAYAWQSNPARRLYALKENRFSGNLYVLFNGRSQSSGAEVPALLHFLGVGTLIGDEPNGSYEGVTGGVLLNLTLPHSGITTSFPLLVYQNAVLPKVFPGRGAPPHFVVRQGLDDAIHARDTVLNFALDLIAARSTQK
jgi:hypothetical protein